MIRRPYGSTYMNIDITKVSTARPGSASVRTTIPAHVAVQLGLEAGSELSWKLDKVRGRWMASVSKRRSA